MFCRETADPVKTKGNRNRTCLYDKTGKQQREKQRCWLDKLRFSLRFQYSVKMPRMPELGKNILDILYKYIVNGKIWRSKEDPLHIPKKTFEIPLKNNLRLIDKYSTAVVY